MAVKVLVVEDDHLVRKTLANILTMEGFDVRTASTLQEADWVLDCVDVAVVLDLELPDGNGIDLLRRIRVEKRPMKVIVATASGDKKLLETVRAQSPDGLFNKPFDMRELLEILRDGPVQ